MRSHVRLRFSPMLGALLAVLTAFTLCALAVPPPAEAQKKKVLNIAAKEPDTLDPHTSTIGQAQAITRFMYRGLTRFAIKDGKVTTAEVEPDLAESWSLSPDGTVWTFKLRKGVQFHKGFGELTAEDVKFSFDRQINKAPGTRFGVNLEVIKSIEVVDPYTVQIALKSFDPIFLLRMVGYQQGYIVSKKAAEKHGEQFKWNPVGTGPFYFDRHSPREKIVLKAFDKYHGGRPQIDEVHWFDVPEDATKLIGLEKGTFDLLFPEAVTADFADQVKKMGAVIDRRGPGGQERFYINMTKPPFDDIRVRRAFMHAIDRKAIKETMYPGGLARAGDELYPARLLRPHPDGVPEYDPEKAKKLLAEAGHPERLHDQELLHQQVVLLSQGAHAGPGAAQEGGHHRGAPGRRARDLPREHPEEPEPLRALRRHAHPRRRPLALAVLRLQARSRIRPPATRARTSPTTGASTTCWRQGRVERDVKKRAAIYHETQKRIQRDLICLPISDVPGQWARNPKRVSTPFDPEYGEFSLHYSYNYPEMLKVLN